MERREVTQYHYFTGSVLLIKLISLSCVEYLDPFLQKFPHLDISVDSQVCLQLISSGVQKPISANSGFKGVQTYVAKEN